MKRFTAIAAILCSSLAHADPPGWCTSEHGAVARLICSDEELWTLDAEVFGEFNSWQSNVQGEERQNRYGSHGEWIRERNERCGLNGMKPDAPLETLLAAKSCMLKAYEERKQFYDSVMWN
jgi:uncharacterized protein